MATAAAHSTVSSSTTSSSAVRAPLECPPARWTPTARLTSARRGETKTTMHPFAPHSNWQMRAWITLRSGTRRLAPSVAWDKPLRSSSTVSRVRSPGQCAYVSAPEACPAGASQGQHATSGGSGQGALDDRTDRMLTGRLGPVSEHGSRVVKFVFTDTAI